MPARNSELVLTYFFLTSARYFRGVFATPGAGNLTVGGDERGENNRKDPLRLRKELTISLF